MSHLLSTEKLDEIGSAVALQKAVDRGGRMLAHGCRLFHVEQGWESAMISKDPAVPSCSTLLELEAAVQKSDVKVIFIPIGAMITDEGIEKICHRNGVVKTLFKEVKRT